MLLFNFSMFLAVLLALFDGKVLKSRTVNAVYRADGENQYSCDFLPGAVIDISVAQYQLFYNGPVDRQGSQLLFHLIAQAYEKRSLIIPTNLEFSRWGSIFSDEQMAAAMIDRLVHHGHLLLFEGKSYRLEYALMRQGLTENIEETMP